MSTPDKRGWGRPGNVPLTRINRWDGVSVTMHSDIAELVSMLMDLSEASGYDVRQGETWGYNPRKVAGTKVWSTHAWGLAIDINALANRRGGQGDIPPEIVDLWRNHGFIWGGDWAYTDCMHLEFSGTPADAARITARLRTFLGGTKPPQTQPEESMRMLIDKRDGTVWLFGCNEPKSLGGKPNEYNRLLALGIPSTEDDGLLIDFLRGH